MPRTPIAAEPIGKTDMPKTKPVDRFESFNEIATIGIELEDAVDQKNTVS